MTCLLLSYLFLFFAIPKYVQAQNNILSYLMGWPIWIPIIWKWDNLLTGLAGNDESRLVWFRVFRNSLANEIYHFFSFSQWAGCPLYLTNLLHIISSLVPYSASFACSGMLSCRKCWSWGFEILSPFFSECSFYWLQHFSSNCGYLFDLIFCILNCFTRF